jgi:uncharacterized membrane protein
MATLTHEQRIRRRRTNRRILTWLVGPIGIIFLLLGLLIHVLLLFGLICLALAVGAHFTNPANVPA